MIRMARHSNKKKGIHKKKPLNILFLMPESDPEFNPDLIPQPTIQSEEKFDLVDDLDLIGNTIKQDDEQFNSDEYSGQ